jgi:predicted DNA-binding transcriptional regulator AlpA
VLASSCWSEPLRTSKPIPYHFGKFETAIPDRAPRDCVLTEAETAKVLGYSRDTLRREFRRGQAPSRVRLSERRIGYRWSEIDRWLKARTESPGKSSSS